MELQELLTHRFIKAVKTAFPVRTPLIGPRWFKLAEREGLPHFHFTGVGSIAKAVKLPSQVVARRILEGLNMRELDAEAIISPDAKVIVLKFHKPMATY